MHIYIFSPCPSLLDWTNVQNTETQRIEHRNEVPRIDIGIMVLHKFILIQRSYFPSKHHRLKGIDQHEEEGLKVGQML